MSWAVTLLYVRIGDSFTECSANAFAWPSVDGRMCQTVVCGVPSANKLSKCCGHINPSALVARCPLPSSDILYFSFTKSTVLGNLLNNLFLRLLSFITSGTRSTHNIR